MLDTTTAIYPHASSIFTFPLRRQPLAQQLSAIVLGTLFLTLSSYASVPLLPVPLTLQTFSVVLIGALYGWRLGSITILTWLVHGALGLPVFANGAGGMPYFLGPTGGYLFAFPIAGALMGWLAERGWNGNRVLLACSGMLISHAICLILGAAWLATFIGAKQAMAHGILPFLSSTLLKSTLGGAILKMLTPRQ